MTQHIVQQVLEHIQSVLIAANTTAGDRVYVDRVDPLDDQLDMPAILVSEVGESVKALTVSIPSTVARHVVVRIEPVVAHVTDYGKNVRQLCAEVEATLLAAPANLGGLADGRVWLREAKFSADGDADRVTAGRAMLFECRLKTKSNDPRTPL